LGVSGSKRGVAFWEEERLRRFYWDIWDNFRHGRYAYTTDSFSPPSGDEEKCWEKVHSGMSYQEALNLKPPVDHWVRPGFMESPQTRDEFLREQRQK
jgi:hypothetical protein